MEFPIHGAPISSQSSTPRRSPTPSQSSSPAHQRPTSAANSPARRNGGTTGGVATEPSTKKNAFSKFFSQLKNLIAEAATIEPTSDVAPGVDHCCRTSRCHYGLPIHHLDPELLAFGSQCASPGTSSSNSIPRVSSRLIVYRDCDRRGRKILFDSEHVTSEYVYMKPSDPKLLKQLGEYVFGCVPLASTSSSTLSLDTPPISFGHMRFCKWKVDGKFEQPNKTLYIWSKIFETGSFNRSTKKASPAKSTDYSSSPSGSEQSTSGFESGGAYSSSTGKTYSLPLFNQRLSSSPSGSSGTHSFPQTKSLPGRFDNYKTNLALVWILTQEAAESDSEGESSGPTPKIPFPYLSPLMEQLMLNPLSYITQKFYHNSDHFITSLKNVSSSLNYDLRDFLTNHHVVNLSLVKPPLSDMVNSKLLCRFLELYLTNLRSCVVLNLKKWTEVKAILYFWKMVLRIFVCKCSLPDSRRDSLVETGTDVAYDTDVTTTTTTTTSHELDCVDSGIELEGNTSSSARIQAVSSTYHGSRKWSIVSEEGSDLGIGGGESSQDELDCSGTVSFHLGDADVDQSEAKLALGEVDLSKLKRGGRRSSVESSASVDILGSDSEFVPPSSSNRPPLAVKLSMSDSKLKDACSAKYTPCYHCNGTYITEHSKFNPFYSCQVLTKPGQPVTFDMEYVSFIKIIELYGAGAVRSFNLSDEKTPLASSNASSSLLNLSTDDGTEANDLSNKIKEFVEGYIQLAKMTNDNGKLDSFVTFQMEEMRKYIL